MNNDEKILKALETLQTDISEVKQGQKQIREDVKTVDMKVEAFNYKLDTTAKEIKEEIKEAIEREAKANADSFSETFEKLDKQEELEKRMERIEKHLDLPQL